ncbi:MAG: hypothetical protein DYH08_09760 [Actinobacteria bacterium ATB1]|nr:hypothetical protein [Actinobacteria bacterium ATB1]
MFVRNVESGRRDRLTPGVTHVHRPGRVVQGPRVEEGAGAVGVELGDGVPGDDDPAPVVDPASVVDLDDPEIGRAIGQPARGPDEQRRMPDESPAAWPQVRGGGGTPQVHRPRRTHDVEEAFHVAQ